MRRLGIPLAALGLLRRTIAIEPLHPRSASPDVEGVPEPRTISSQRAAAAAGTKKKEVRQPLDAYGPSVFHGLTGDARRALAEAEEEYERSLQYLDGKHARTIGEDDSGGAEAEAETMPRRIAAPFMERMVPSYKEAHAHRGNEGELRPREAQWVHNRHSELCIKTENQLTELIESGLPYEEKVGRVTEIMAGVMSAGLFLQPSCFEDVSALLMATPFRPHQPFPHTTLMVEMYKHMKQTFTAPTAAIMEHLMVCVARQAEEHEENLHLATRLLIDADRYVVLPSRTMLSAYFDVCATNHAMELAVTRYADAIAKLGITPDAGMLTSLLTGLTKNGMIEEAVALAAHVQHVHVNTPLMNATLDCFLLSSDPSAVFSAYDALAGVRFCKPDSQTFLTILMACQRLDRWDKVKMVLHEMQRLRVRGDADTLNLLLKGLLKADLHQYAEQLFLSMVNKRIVVWPELERALPEKTQRGADKLRRASNIIGHLRMASESGSVGDEEPHDGHFDFSADADRPNSIAEDSQPGRRRGTLQQRLDERDAQELDAILDATPSPSSGNIAGIFDDAAAPAEGPTCGAEESTSNEKEAPDEEVAADEGSNGRRRGSSGRAEQYIKPRSIHHLKIIAAKQRLRFVDPEFLRDFLVHSGAVAASEVDDLPRHKLIAHTHKELFGVSPSFKTAPIVGVDRDAKKGPSDDKLRAWRRRQRHSGRRRSSNDADDGSVF